VHIGPADFFLALVKTTNAASEHESKQVFNFSVFTVLILSDIIKYIESYKSVIGKRNKPLHSLSFLMYCYTVICR